MESQHICSITLKIIEKDEKELNWDKYGFDRDNSDLMKGFVNAVEGVATEGIKSLDTANFKEETEEKLSIKWYRRLSDLEEKFEESDDGKYAGLWYIRASFPFSVSDGEFVFDSEYLNVVSVDMEYLGDLTNSIFEAALEECWDTDVGIGLLESLESKEMTLKAGDREFVLATVQKNGRALKYAAESLQADHQIVLAALQQDGRVLAHAAESLQADPQIVLAAVQQDGSALKYATESLRQDREIVVAAKGS